MATRQGEQADLPRVFDAVERALPHEFRLRHGRGEPDLILEWKGGERVAVEVKRTHSTRHDDVIGRFATGAVEIQSYAQDPRGLVLIAVPHATAGTAAALRDFAARHLPKVGWGLVDDRDTVFLEIPFWNLSRHERGAAAESRASVRGPLFTDLNAWLLKILMLHDAPPNMWSGPREHVRSVEDLLRISDVSKMTAYRFAQTFEADDLLRRSPDGLTLIRRDELVRRWRTHASHLRHETLYVRWRYGEPDNLDAVLGDAPGFRWAVAGFAACRALGVQHAAFTTSEVYVDYPRRAMEAWELSACDPRDAHLLLLRTQFPQSIFRGAPTVGRLRIVDILQAALDVVRHAARGDEQADYILHDVLGWRDA